MLAFGEMNEDVTLMQNRLRFPGQYYDAESGLHYNYFRNFDPTTGRYVESDPIGLAGTFNTYMYANNSPVVYVDNEGRIIINLIGAAIGGVCAALQGGSWRDIAIGAVSGALPGLGGFAVSLIGDQINNAIDNSNGNGGCSLGSNAGLTASGSVLSSAASSGFGNADNKRADSFRKSTNRYKSIQNRKALKKLAGRAATKGSFKGGAAGCVASMIVNALKN